MNTTFLRWLIMLAVLVGLVSGLRFLLGGDEMGAVWISVGLFVIASHFLPTWSWASRSGGSTAR